jgi:hypothetical protein
MILKEDHSFRITNNPNMAAQQTSAVKNTPALIYTVLLML